MSVARMLAVVVLIQFGASVVRGQEPAAEVQAAKDRAVEAKAGEANGAAVELLKKVDEAAKAVKTCRYKSERVGSGGLADQIATLRGTVTVGEMVEKVGAPKIRVAGSRVTSNSEDAAEFVVGFDGEDFYLLDMQRKIAYVDVDQQVIGSDGGQLLVGLTMPEFTHPAPFSDEINAEKAEIVGTEEVAGEMCNVVQVVYAGGRGEAKWWFSKRDLLPRRREQMIRARDVKGSWILTVRELEVNPKFEEGTFEFAVPEGFEESEDFAPNRAIMK